MMAQIADIWQRSSKKYLKHFLWADLAVTLVLFWLYFIWEYWCGGRDVLPGYLSGNRSQLYSAVMGAFASLLGFALTAKTVAMTVMTSERFERVTSRNRDQLWSGFNQTMLALGAGATLSLGCLVFDRDPKDAAVVIPVCVLFNLVVFLLILSAFRLYRCVYLLTLIARILGAPGAA